MLPLNLSTSALPQSQHQIGALLSRAHVLAHLSPSAPPPPPQTAISNERPWVGSPYTSRNPASQWHKGISHSQRLPTRREGRRAATGAVRDEWWLAEIAGCCGTISPSVTSMLFKGSAHNIHRHTHTHTHTHKCNTEYIQMGSIGPRPPTEEGMSLFVSPHRAGLSWAITRLIHWGSCDAKRNSFSVWFFFLFLFLFLCGDHPNQKKRKKGKLKCVCFVLWLCWR